jgi:hypothetical protein
LPEELSFVDRRHIDIANLRAGSADLQNLFLRFDLTRDFTPFATVRITGRNYRNLKEDLQLPSGHELRKK